MGKLFLEYLSCNNIYICSSCKTHLTSYNDLISKVIQINENTIILTIFLLKAFRGRGGKAYLFTNV